MRTFRRIRSKLHDCSSADFAPGRQRPALLAPHPVRLHHYVPLLVPATDDGPRPHRPALPPASLPGRRASRSSGALLDQGAGRQFRRGGGDGHPHGVPVRHQLGPLLAVRGRGHRPDADHGKHLRFLPRVHLPRPRALRREETGQGRTSSRDGSALPRLVALRIFHHCHQRLHAAPGRLPGGGRSAAAPELLGLRAQRVGSVAVRAQHVRLGRDRLFRGGGNRGLLDAARPRGGRGGEPADGSDAGADRLRPAALSHRRSPRKAGGAAPAGRPRRDGGGVRGRASGAPGHHRPTEPGRPHAGEPDPRAGRAQLPRLRFVRQHGEGAVRLPHLRMARQHRAPLLRVPHHGRAGLAVHRVDGGVGRAALARPACLLAAALVDADARHSLPVHREHGRLDGGGARTAAVDHLRTHAHRGRHLAARRSRRYRLHHAGLPGPLLRRVPAVPLPGRAGDRPRPRARFAGEALDPARLARLRCPGEGTVIPFWYGVVAVMLSVYVVLDGFDFGAGILHLFVARTDRERREVLAAIGPVWDGNEVWLIASGGVLVLAFPRAYAVGFSGFYLPLMMVLWLLVLRGLSIELRSHLENPLWRSFWDAVLGFASAVMAIVLGAALGNVLRGVLIGVFAFASLAAHGALYLAGKTEGMVRERALAAARVAWPAVAAIGLGCIVCTWQVRPELYTGLAARPWSWPLPVLAAAALAGVFAWLFRGRERSAFLCSAAFLASTLAATAAGLFPLLLPSTIAPAFSLTAAQAATGQHGLRVALIWWTLGISLAVGYAAFLYRSA